MGFASGTRLGVYEVVAPLGEGGMGVVYRALDTRLGRHVAIKVLPDTFAADPDRLARFEREARLRSSTNHRHTQSRADARGIVAWSRGLDKNRHGQSERQP